MQPVFDTTKIDPKRGAKYSPNLHKWMRREMRRAPLSRAVFRDSQGSLWIGYNDEDTYLIGSRLIAVLCSRSESMAHPIMHRLTELPEFWSAYAADGRCAIDPEHQMHFIGDETRWRVRGDERECLWCGRVTQRRETYEHTTTRERWV